MFKTGLLLALTASTASAFAPAASLRVSKAPGLVRPGSTSPGLALGPSLAARPRPYTTRAPMKAAAAAAGPLSSGDKRMFVRWSYIMCLANSLVNSATLIQFDEVVMHMTGPSSKGPLFLASGLAAQGWHNLGTIGAFLFGCLLAGLATAKKDGDTPIPPWIHSNALPRAQVERCACRM